MSVVRLCSKLGFFRVDANTALPITTIRTGRGHPRKVDGKYLWSYCIAAFHTVQLVEMAPNVFATAVRMLEVPTNEELSLMVSASYASSPPPWRPWSDRASPVAPRGVGCTATASNHIPEGLLRHNIRGEAEWAVLMNEHSNRVIEARSLLREAVLQQQSPLSWSSSRVEVLVDACKEVETLERCAAFSPR